MSAMKSPMERLHFLSSAADVDPALDVDNGILNQDLFCTPDYITPENQNNTFIGFDCPTIANALQFMHERGMAHFDIKPDNIYVKNGMYKLGDFGCATLLDESLPIEEGDARYMPSEILNEKHDYLDKVDIFSLGVAMYELIRGSPLPVEGPQTINIKQGKLPLLPNYSIQLQNLLKAMLDPNPHRRPSAKDLMKHSIFHRKHPLA